MLAWRFNASLAAASALFTRSPELLRSTLLSADPPKNMLCWKGVYLATLEDPRAVPILCETVPKRFMMDDSMFDAIERLAQPEHLPAVAALLASVREEQRERAARAVAAVRARLAR